MSDAEHIPGFRDRWGLEEEPGESFARFRNRLLSAVGTAAGQYVLATPAIESSFRMRLAIAEPTPKYSPILGMVGYLNALSLTSVRNFADCAVYERLASAPDVSSVAEALEALFSALAEQVEMMPKRAQSSTGEVNRGAPRAQTILNNLVSAVACVIDLSPGIDIRLVRRGNTVTLYPGGATALDKAVVEDVLGFLGRHAKVAEKFAHALRTYLGKNPEQARNLLDDLRFCLEQLLREILSNTKPLEKQMPALGPWLDRKDVHSELRNMYSTLLTHFAAYQNDAVKHDEKWSPPEIEFTIYLTGTFMRMLLQLEAEG